MTDRAWRRLYLGTIAVMLAAFTAFYYGTRRNEQPATVAPAVTAAPANITDTAGTAASDIPLPPLDGELY